MRLSPSLYQSAIYLVFLAGLAALYATGRSHLAGLGASVLVIVRAGTYGMVELQAPLRRRIVGRQYTISWAATFDNGGHACPSELTPENTTPKPFVVTVAR